MWYKGLVDDLISQGDEKKALEMSSYMRNQFPFLGVSRPERKRMYKNYFKGLGDNLDWDFVDFCYSQDEREYQYLAIDYLNEQKHLLSIGDIKKIRSLITIKSWWDSVDGFPRIVGYLILREVDAKSIMLEWSLDENFWVRRVAIISQLLFKEKTDVDLLEKIIVNNLGSKEFFINKAIGWILRDYSKTNKEWVTSFIDKYRVSLDKLSIREGSKYLD